MDTMRERFSAVTSALLDEDPRLAVVLADISADSFGRPRRRHPDRVINVGIREQLLISVDRRAGPGRAAADRAHVRQLPGRAALRADQAGPQPPGRRRRAGQRGRVLRQLRQRAHPPVARATSRCWTRCRAGRCTCPGTRTRPNGRSAAAAAGGRPGLRAAVAPRPTRCRWRARPGRLTVLRTGRQGTVLVTGPLADAAIDATLGLDVTVLYAATVRPFDAAHAAGDAGRARGRAGRAVPGRHLGGRGDRGAARPAAPGARARRRPRRNCAATAPRPSTRPRTAWTPGRCAPSISGFLAA